MPKVDSIKTLTDQDGDVIMSESDTTLLPLNPFKENFNFDWFSFDGKAPSPKSPTYSPASPNSTRKLSISTASPSSYFTDSSLSSEPSAKSALDLGIAAPPRVVYTPPPAKPLKWVWQCHLCHSRYPLSVTRRCLIDGHYYCSGNSQAQRNVKRRRKNQSCISEFDYVAWKEWGQWRRKTLALRALANGKQEPKLLGCDGCSSPSQCRYDKRKPVEIIKFDDFIDEDDLFVNADETNTSKNGISEMSPPLGLRSPLKEEKSSKGKKPGVKKNLKIDSNPSSSSLNQKSSKRHRFYSDLSANLSTRELSPTSESSRSLDSGKFDPTLPSVTRSSIGGDGDLKAIESTLKAALATQNRNSLHGDVAQSVTKSKRRTNSKASDPQFETTPEDSQNGSRAGGETNALYRTRSQQSLLTDFFRQARTPNSGDPVKRDVSRAASEADIAAFLESKPRHQLDELNSHIKRHQSVQASNGQHFEDIVLSPTKAHSTKGSLTPNKVEEPINDQTVAGSDATNAQADVAGENGRAGISFGFPNFMFGRK